MVGEFIDLINCLSPICISNLTILAPDDPVAAAFQSFLAAFKYAPTCSIDDTHGRTVIPNDNDFKRDLNNHLASRDPELHQLVQTRSISGAGGPYFVSLVSSAMQGKSRYSLIMQQEWETTFGSIYNFHPADFQETYQIFPDYDPNSLTQDILCNLQNAEEALSNARTAQSELCVDYTTGHSKRLRRRDNATEATRQLWPLDIGHGFGRSRARNFLPRLISSSALLPTHGPRGSISDDFSDGTLVDHRKEHELVAAMSINATRYHKLVARVFEQDAGNTGSTSTGIPFTGRILQAVTNNQVPLLYIRQLRFQDNPEINLEVVFDLRNVPALQEQTGDIFAVFHFHTQGLTTDGVPEITYFHVFHAQTVYPRYGGWRVDGRLQGEGANNERTVILDCPIDANTNTRQVWRPGPHGEDPDPDDDTAVNIYNFGNALWNRGILNDASFYFPSQDTNTQYLMWWDSTNENWNFNNLRESTNFGAGGNLNTATDMSPSNGWPQTRFS